MERSGGVEKQPKTCIICDGTGAVKGHPCPKCTEESIEVELASADEVFGPKAIEPKAAPGMKPRVLVVAIAAIAVLAGAIGWGVGRLNSAGADMRPDAPGADGLRQTSTPAHPAVGVQSVPPSPSAAPLAARPALEARRPGTQAAPRTNAQGGAARMGRTSPRDRGRGNAKTTGTGGIGAVPSSGGNQWNQGSSAGASSAQPGRVTSQRAGDRPDAGAGQQTMTAPPRAPSGRKQGGLGHVSRLDESPAVRENQQAAPTDPPGA